MSARAFVIVDRDGVPRAAALDLTTAQVALVRLATEAMGYQSLRPECFRIASVEIDPTPLGLVEPLLARSDGSDGAERAPGSGR